MNHKKYWVILFMVWAQFACGGGGSGTYLTGGGNETAPIKSDLAVSNIIKYSVAVVSMLSLPSN
jgi:hypothetical protein